MTDNITTYYAIEEMQDNWTVIAVTTDRRKAHKIKRGIMKGRSKYGIPRARVLKARPEVVKAYLLMGNKLW